MKKFLSFIFAYLLANTFFFLALIIISFLPNFFDKIQFDFTNFIFTWGKTNIDILIFGLFFVSVISIPTLISYKYINLILFKIK